MAGPGGTADMQQAVMAAQAARAATAANAVPRRVAPAGAALAAAMAGMRLVDPAVKVGTAGPGTGRSRMEATGAAGATAAVHTVVMVETADMGETAMVREAEEPAGAAGVQWVVFRGSVVLVGQGERVEKRVRPARVETAVSVRRDPREPTG